MITLFEKYNLDNQVSIEIKRQELAAELLVNYKGQEIWSTTYHLMVDGEYQKEPYVYDIYDTAYHNSVGKDIEKEILNYVERNFLSSEMGIAYEKSDVKIIGEFYSTYFNLDVEFEGIKFLCQAKTGDQSEIQDFDFKDENEKKKWEDLSNYSKFGLMDIPKIKDISDYVLDYLFDNY